MRIIIILCTIIILIKAYSQKWYDWRYDTTYSITKCMKVEKIRWHKTKKVKTFERIEEYYNQCGTLDYSVYSKGEAHFRPLFKKYKIKESKNKCSITNESKFPFIADNEIDFSINYEDSTLTIQNNSSDSLIVWTNNEWEYKGEGFYLGEIAPNSFSTLDLEYCFYFHDWLQYLEFRTSNTVIKRDVLKINYPD